MTKVKKKNLGGRPKTVLSKKQIEEVETLAQYLTIDQIADHLGISHGTFYGIRERQSEVFKSYKMGKSKAIGFAASRLMQKVREGDTTSTIFFLKTQAGWSEKQQIDMNANISGSTFPQFIFEVDGKSKKD